MSPWPLSQPQGTLSSRTVGSGPVCSLRPPFPAHPCCHLQALRGCGPAVESHAVASCWQAGGQNCGEPRGKEVETVTEDTLRIRCKPPPRKRAWTGHSAPRLAMTGSVPCSGADITGSARVLAGEAGKHVSWCLQAGGGRRQGTESKPYPPPVTARTIFK